MELYDKCFRNYCELKENEPERMNDPKKFKEHKWWCIIQIRKHKGCDCKE